MGFVDHGGACLAKASQFKALNTVGLLWAKGVVMCVLRGQTRGLEMHTVLYTQISHNSLVGHGFSILLHCSMRQVARIRE